MMTQKLIDSRFFMDKTRVNDRLTCVLRWMKKLFLKRTCSSHILGLKLRVAIEKFTSFMMFCVYNIIIVFCNIVNDVIDLGFISIVFFIILDIRMIFHYGMLFMAIYHIHFYKKDVIDFFESSYWDIIFYNHVLHDQYYFSLWVIFTSYVHCLPFNGFMCYIVPLDGLIFLI